MLNKCDSENLERSTANTCREISQRTTISSRIDIWSLEIYYHKFRNDGDVMKQHLSQIGHLTDQCLEVLVSLFSCAIKTKIISNNNNDIGKS